MPKKYQEAYIVCKGMDDLKVTLSSVPGEDKPIIHRLTKLSEKELKELLWIVPCNDPPAPLKTL